jgi:hypothetical protein
VARAEVVVIFGRCLGDTPESRLNLGQLLRQEDLGQTGNGVADRDPAVGLDLSEIIVLLTRDFLRLFFITGPAGARSRPWSGSRSLLI